MKLRLFDVRFQELRPVLYTAEQLAAGHPGGRRRDGASSNSSCGVRVGGGAGGSRGKGALSQQGGGGGGVRLAEQQERLRDLLSTVVPFDSVNFKAASRAGSTTSTQRGLEVCACSLIGCVGGLCRWGDGCMWIGWVRGYLGWLARWWDRWTDGWMHGNGCIVMDAW
jgi:hypothetical protein